jgi:hypothetical protein
LGGAIGLKPAAIEEGAVVDALDGGEAALDAFEVLVDAAVGGGEFVGGVAVVVGACAEAIGAMVP